MYTGPLPGMWPWLRRTWFPYPLTHLVQTTWPSAAAKMGVPQ